MITPHLSTGGAPQFTLNKIKLLNDSTDIYCVEYSFLSSDFVVQRNQIIDILEPKSRFYSLNDNKFELFRILEHIKPDIIFMEEFPENFMSNDITKILYSVNRDYKIIETTHSSIKVEKIWLPDKFIFVSEYSKNMYSDLNINYEIIEYPIDIKTDKKVSNNFDVYFDPNYKHVLNVGLFTRGKNQGYIFDLAKKLIDCNIKFHFVGNLAGNFMDYWEPIMKDKPENCIIHGERSDVDNFFKSSDLFLFTSRFELNPLVVKEAIMHQIPTLMFNLETYCGAYDNVDTITFLTGDIELDKELILKKLNLNMTYEFKNRNQLPHFLNSLGLTNKGVEIGTFKGQYSNTILSNWCGKLYMVDVWRTLSDEEYDDASNHKNHITAYSEAMDNISGYEDRAYMLRMDSKAASELFNDNSLDFVYIDANHTYKSVKDDIEFWYPKVKSGGLVLGHDYLPKNMYNGDTKDIPLYLFPDGKPEESYYAGMFGVNPAVDEFVNIHGYNVNCTDEFLGTWWIIKK